MRRSKIRRATWSAGWTLIGALALGGCATVPAPSPGGSSSPMPGRSEPASPQTGSAETPTPAPVAPPVAGTPVGTTASGGSITQATRPVTPADSLPSAEARAVLSTIPAPEGSREVVGAAPAASAPAPADSAEAPAAADTTTEDAAGDLPIPSLTQPLGDRPGARASSDTAVSSAPATSPSSPPPSTAAPAPAGDGSPDPCWRVQVAAVPEQPRAKALREAAQSQLWVPWVIEVEKGLHKIRTQNCLTSEAADRLRQRAIAAGFQGAFKFRRPK